MTEVIKMSSNTSAVRGLHGRSQDGVQCRRCQHTENKPIETLAHVLGACHYGHLLRVNRHNTVRALIANELRKSYEVYEEVGGLANDGSVRRIDIIAIDRKKKSGIIIDPTIRFEVQQVQPLEIDKDKKDISYLLSVTHYKEKYSLEEIEVVGLMIGARGTITSFFINFCKRFNINQETMKRIVHATIRSFIHILRKYTNL
uniref:Reverse transcriptase n=1 Tax=Cacopsylla melanoneura TaxID=428564 RepID=A0A8D8W4U5_9HEMI